MDLRVLGPVEAQRRRSARRASRGRWLAMLALSEGTPISADQLIDGL
jgi:hypothetical protein